jgi:hypothetical protein
MMTMYSMALYIKSTIIAEDALNGKYATLKLMKSTHAILDWGRCVGRWRGIGCKEVVAGTSVGRVRYSS